MKLTKFTFNPKSLLNINFFVLSVFTALATFLRFKKLTFQSLWLDELGSVNYVSVYSNNIINIIDISKHHDLNPPFYYIILWIWKTIFGHNEYSVKSLSAIIGILGVISIYFLGKELFSKTAGIYALAILSLNIFHIYYSQEVRCFSLIFLLSTLSFLFFVRQLKKPHIKNSLFYIITTILLLYSHYYGLFILASQVIILIFIFFSHRKKTEFIKYNSLSLISIFLLYIPWLPTIKRITEVDQFWINKPNADFFIKYFKNFFGQEPFLVTAFSALLLIYLINDSKKNNFKQDKILLLLWVFITLFLPYFRSFNHPAPLIERYTIVVLPALILMGSRAIEFIKEKGFQILLLSLIVLMSFINIFYTDGNYYKKIQKQQWRGVAFFAVRNDPEKKYPIYAHEYFSYYINKIFNHNVKINHELFRNRKQAKKIYNKIKDENIPGIWVLEAHRLIDDDVHEFLTKKLIKEKSIELYGAKGTLYLNPNKSEDF